MRKPLFLFGILFCLAGCEITQEKHGFVFDACEWTHIQQGVGKLTKSQVFERLGTPSCVVAFDPNTWYYISQIIENQAFFYPRETQLRGYALEFNTRDILTKITPSTQVVSLTPALETTKLPSSHGEEFLKQVFRNVGRFSPIPNQTKRP